MIIGCSLGVLLQRNIDRLQGLINNNTICKVAYWCFLCWLSADALEKVDLLFRT